MGEGNAAVQAVGRRFFLLTMAGYLVAIVTMFPAVLLGVSENYFRFKMDRCSCVSNTTTSSSGWDDCEYGRDEVTVQIGWQKYTISNWTNNDGCPSATAEYGISTTDINLDDPRSPLDFDEVYPLDGEFQKSHNPTQADESNGGAEAGGGVVAMQVVCAFFSIITFKMLKESYVTNGSHCSIGLNLMTRINMLVCIGLASALVSFWWLIEGRFGQDNEALTQALENTIFNECWMETTDQNDCPVRAWEFTGPGSAFICGLAQVGIYFLSTMLMIWKAPLVEGVLDGSMDKEGVVLKPRVVEVEMVVGKALATDGDPDYDSENPLYNGATTMIRPYPLPKSAKANAVGDEVGVEPSAPEEAVIQDGTNPTEYESKSDPEIGEEQMSGMHSEYNGGPDLEMIVEESEEDRASSRYSETRYSEASRYSDTYSDYGDRPTRNAQGRGALREHVAPSR